jgi:hypothetical protein
MTIFDMDCLEEFDQDAVIFAELIGGNFTPQSRAEVILLSPAESEKPIAQVAKQCCPTLRYCLEVHIARDAIEVWSRWHDGIRYCL